MATVHQTFDQIAQEHDAMIKRIASSYEAKPHLAEELVQEIILRYGERCRLSEVMPASGHSWHALQRIAPLLTLHGR